MEIGEESFSFHIGVNLGLVLNVSTYNGKIERLTIHFLSLVADFFLFHLLYFRIYEYMSIFDNGTKLFYKKSIKYVHFITHNIRKGGVKVV